MKRVLGLGISPFFMNSTEGILQVVLIDNYFLAVILPLVLLQLWLQWPKLSFSPMEGIAQGSQPIISFNYGARQKNELLRQSKW
ncbi:MAG: hypothetical protein V8R63_08035 [Thomasclavelia ramosa]